ncbi:MAG: beta-glucosidase BglX [Candidatus Marinimicrobia bacterium]|nr:beta-glucosidase BglX [Candidatus Neomarinimicrobiota bacterium]
MFKKFFLTAIFVFSTIFIQAKIIDAEIEKKVNTLLQKMTLEEKIGQLNQYSSTWELTGPTPEDETNQNRLDDIKSGRVGSMLNVVSAKETRAAQKLAVENSRLGIPLIFGLDVIHGFRTIFPVPLGQAASWDMEVIKQGARIAATEAAAAGIHWTFAPMVDISRDPRWGRIMEGAGEDPYLGSQIAKALVQGYQGKSLSSDNTIVACAKHYAAYGGAIAGRDYNSVDLSMYDLYNIYLPPYKACIDAEAGTFMNSFNTLNGIPATGNQFLVNNILRDKWQFSGLLLSDWNSIGELIPHGLAKNLKEAARIALQGSTDMDMESSAYINHLAELVKTGTIQEEQIDNAVKRVLTLKYKLGLFDDPYKYCSTERERSQIYSHENQSFALEMARESIVLLKNNNILPLSKEIGSIAVVGPLAADKDNPLGSWRCQGEENTAVSLLSGIRKAVSSKTKIHYAKGCDLLTDEQEYQFHNQISINKDNYQGISKAVKIAEKADVVIAAVGETALMSGEARSRMNIDLPGVQNKLMEELTKIGKPIIVVLFNGRPLAIPEIDKNAAAVVESWLAGSQSGNAIAEVLFGDHNPGGKLPVTFPRHVGQIPIYYNHLNTGRPVMENSDIFVSGYTDGPSTPLYPFGYGLSYTTFEYSNLKLSNKKLGMDKSLTVSVDLTNTGERKGKETVQLYIRDMVGTYSRPIKELKGFKKVALKPGQTKTVQFEINKDKLSYYNAQYEQIYEPGEFEIMVGGNSVDLLTTKFELLE